MKIDFKDGKFYQDDQQLPLIEAFNFWLSPLKIDWTQSAFQQMLKLTNTKL